MQVPERLVNWWEISWLGQKAENDPHVAFCLFCQKRLSVAGQGIKHLAFHMKGEKRKQKTLADPAASKLETLMFVSTSDPMEELSPRKILKGKDSIHLTQPC